jgi:hypothetical protein
MKLYAGLDVSVEVEAGLPAVCIETRYAKAAIGAMAMNKNDRNDARPRAPRGSKSGKLNFT